MKSFDWIGKGWTWEEHQLSEGFSCIVYDEHGRAIADHLDRDTAANISAARELFAAAEMGLRALEGIQAALSRNGMMVGDECPAIPALRDAITKARGADRLSTALLEKVG